MDETGMQLPVVFRQGLRQSHVEAEVIVFLCQRFEITLIEQLLQRTGSIPVAYPSGCIFSLQKVGEVRPERRHTGSSTQVNHLPVRLLDVKFTEGAYGSYHVAGF